jgi:hypothetical protein
MKWLLRVNVVAMVVYASFVAAMLVADVWIFPKLSALTPPPEAVGVAIRQGGDIDGLREIALVLYDHVAEQALTVNMRWLTARCSGHGCISCSLLASRASMLRCWYGYAGHRPGPVPVRQSDCDGEAAMHGYRGGVAAVVKAGLLTNIKRGERSTHRLGRFC